jgi:hypothetical protein
MPDFEFLTGKAAQIVSEQHADAKLSHVKGLPKSSAVVAADFTHLDFTFMRGARSVTISCDEGQFGPPTDHQNMPMGDQPIDPPLGKTLDQAIVLLRAGGYQEPIVQLDLRMPLHPDVTEAIYIFAFGTPVSKVVGVGANTGVLETQS